MEEANKLIGAGKKYLVTGKVPEAVSALQEACSMLAKQYGDTADECGEAFFWSGKSLLDLARMENSVLGNALEGVPEEEEEDEDKTKESNVESTENVDEKTREELRVQVYDAMAEKENEEAEKVDRKQSEDAEESKTASFKAAVEPQEAETVEGDEEQEAGDEEQEAGDEEQEAGDEEQEAGDEEQEAGDEEKEAGDEKENKTEEEKPATEDESANKEGPDKEQEEDAEEPNEGDATAEKDSEDEEVGNLQLAWEMLEVAKVIYKRKDSKEDQLMAAQAHLKLGEVSAESGNYTQALEDYQECLKLQLKHLDPDSRLLAETHYQLGVTYSLNLQYSEAIKALDMSVSVIKNRLEKLQELLDKAEDPEALADERKELEELKVLLPEIQEKVGDATEAAKHVSDGNSSLLPDSTINSDSSLCSATKSSTTPVAVSDISHLLRKKRKPEESPVKEGDVKRMKQDEVQEPNDSNGHADNMEVTT